MTKTVTGESNFDTTTITGATKVANVYAVDFTATFGAVAALVGATVTQTITGLLTTDQVLCNCISAVSPAGLIIANARVSATNTLELTLNTPVALGITLGALNYRVTVFR